MIGTKTKKGMTSREISSVFVPMQEQSGMNLVETIMLFLISLGTTIEHICGQGNDGASSMSAKANGVPDSVHENI